MVTALKKLLWLRPRPSSHIQLCKKGYRLHNSRLWSAQSPALLRPCTTDPSESNHSMKTIPSIFVIFLTRLKNDETKGGGGGGGGGGGEILTLHLNVSYFAGT